MFALHGNPSRKVYAFCILLAGVIIFSLHEAVHVFYTTLRLHPRYTLTMLIPIIICFFSLIPLTEDKEKSTGSRDLLIAIFFVVVLILTQRETNFYSALKETWSIWSSLIYVFSFWILLLGIFLIQVSLDLGRRKRNLSQSIGAGILISYSALWGNIEAQHYGGKISSTLQSFEKQFRTIVSKTLIINVGPKRKQKNLFQFVFLSGAISKDQLDQILLQNFLEEDHKDPFEILAAGDHSHILSRQSCEELTKQGLDHQLEFSQRWNSNDLFYCRIRKTK